MSMMEFYEYVRAIPFKRDNEPVEWVARPELLLRIAKGGLDCKKKGILMGAFFVRHGIPKSRWRFAVVSRRPDKFPHHVLPQVNLLGHWYNFDATYKGDRPFDNRIVTYMEPMKRPGGN